MTDIVDELPLEQWKEWARRDDWHMRFVGSDIRIMIAEIERLRERLGPRGLEVVFINDTGHYVNEKIKAEIERLRKDNRELRGSAARVAPSEVIDRTDFDWHWPVYGKAEK